MQRAIGSLKEMSVRRPGPRRTGASRKTASTRKIGRFNEPETMEDIFKSKRMKKYFKEFLQENLSVEHFLFFESILMYEKLSKETSRKRAGADMLETFVVPGSEYEANISSDTKDVLMGITHFHRLSFQEAKEEVADLMATNHLYDFLERLAKEEESRVSVRNSVNRARHIRAVLQGRRTRSATKVSSENPMFNSSTPDYANVSPTTHTPSPPPPSYRHQNRSLSQAHIRDIKEGAALAEKRRRERIKRIPSARNLPMWEKYIQDGEIEDDSSAFSSASHDEINRMNSRTSSSTIHSDRISSSTSGSVFSLDRTASEWSVASRASNPKALPPPRKTEEDERLVAASV